MSLRLSRDGVTYRYEGGYPGKAGWKKPQSFSRLSKKRCIFCRTVNAGCGFAAYKQITVDILINRKVQDE
jgi:hypothetical protein